MKVHQIYVYVDINDIQSQIKKKEEGIDIEKNNGKCYFHHLSLAAGQYEYFIGINGRKVCSFCYQFCCHN